VHGPDFLIIGAARAGTGWLWSNLRRHPQVWTPPVKELHYFDRSREYPSTSFLAPRSPIERMLARGYRRKFLRQFRTDLSRRKWDLVRWDFAYFLGRCDDDWYRSLFAPGEGRVRGEATPAYAILEAPDVERIATLFPCLRVVFVLRNPIERAWSHLRYRYGPAIRTERMSIAAMCEFVDSPGQALRADYSRTIEIWSRCLSDRRLHVAFHDDLAADPGRFFERVCNFLGVDPGLLAPSDLTPALNAGPAAPIPPDLQRHLARRYQEPIRRLSDTYGAPPSHWLRSVEATIGKNPAGGAHGPVHP